MPFRIFVQSAPPPPPPTPVDATFYVTANEDDAFWRNTTYFSNNSTNTIFGLVPTSFNCRCFWNFSNVTIPQGATINSAYIRCQAANNQGLQFNCFIVGNDIDNAVSPTSYNECEALALTSATVDWLSVPSWLANQYYNTPGFSAVVQEIVNRPGWASGNKMLIAIKYVSASGYRTPKSLEGGYATELHVNYTPAA